LSNSYLLKEDELFFGSKAPGLVFSSNLSYGGFLTPSAFSSLKLGAAVSPIDPPQTKRQRPPTSHLRKAHPLILRDTAIFIINLEI